MSKQVINISDALNLPFSSAIRAGDFIFVSGQVGHIDEKGNEVASVRAQTVQCFEKMKKILEVSGASLKDIVKITAFLADVDSYAEMNEVYKSYFPSQPPARSTVVAGMAMAKMLVEIDCIAYKPAPY